MVEVKSAEKVARENNSRRACNDKHGVGWGRYGEEHG